MEYKGRTINKDKHILDDTKAKAYGEELQKIQEENGTLIARDVLDKAKDKNNPLHEYFVWDNSVASEKWRMHQARLLINSIEIVVSYNGKGTTQKAFFNVRVPVGEDYEGTSETKRVYVINNVALNNPDMRRQIVEKAFEQLEYWRMQYQKYKEFKPIVKAIKEIDVKFKRHKK